MIDKNDSRSGYIGGSDMAYVYGSYETKSFSDWWTYKLTGLRTLDLSYKPSVHCGDILESAILDEVGVDVSDRNIKRLKKGTIAGVNTDALSSRCVHEAKTALHKILNKYILGYSQKISYLRQTFHAMWVCERDTAKIHYLGLSEEDYLNPFAVKVKGNVHTFVLSINDPKFDIKEHEYRIYYLTMCYNSGITPSNDGLELFKIEN